jgi:hypothetical protein
MRNIIRHLPHYTSLVAILLAGTILFIIFSYSSYLEAAIAISLALSYVTWGIIHHYLHHDLHFSVFVEYVAVAALGLVIIFSLIFRA